MEQNLTPIQQAIFDAVGEVQSYKRENKTIPDFAFMSEIENSIKSELKDAIRELIRCKKLEWHYDLNKQPMFGLL